MNLKSWFFAAIMFLWCLAPASAEVLFSDDFNDQDITDWELIQADDDFGLSDPCTVAFGYNAWSADGDAPAPIADPNAFGYDPGKLCIGQNEGQIKHTFAMTAPGTPVTVTLKANNPNGGNANTKLVIGIGNSNFPTSVNPDLPKYLGSHMAAATPYYGKTGFSYQAPGNSIHDFWFMWYGFEEDNVNGNSSDGVPYAGDEALSFLTVDAYELGLTSDAGITGVWDPDLKLEFDPTIGDSGVVKFYRSIDDGATWTLLAQWENIINVPQFDTLYIAHQEPVNAWQIDNIVVEGTVDPYPRDDFVALIDEDFNEAEDLDNWTFENGYWVWGTEPNTVGSVVEDTLASNESCTVFSQAIDTQNELVLVEFEVTQGQNSALFWPISFGLRDADSDRYIVNYAIPQLGYGGVSGATQMLPDAEGDGNGEGPLCNAHGWWNIGAGEPNALLTAGGTTSVRMVFNPFAENVDEEVQVWLNGKLAASYANFSDISNVSDVFFGIGNEGNDVGPTWNFDNIFVGVRQKQCGDGGFDPVDPSQDCFVDYVDYTYITSDWQDCTDPAGSCAPASDDPMWNDAAGKTIDGDLSDWAGANWIALDKDYDGTPMISTASAFAVEWNDAENVIYVAAEIIDPDIQVQPHGGAYNLQDALEISIQATADTDTVEWPPAEQVATLDFGPGSSDPNWTDGQQLVLGTEDLNGNTDYAIWGSTWDSTNVGVIVLDYEVAVVDPDQDGNGTIIYEVKLQPFEKFYKDNPSANVVKDLASGSSVRVDVVASDKYDPVVFNGPEFGQAAENLQPGKFYRGSNVMLWQLFKVTGSCGDWGYLDGDVNNDCYVDVDDIRTMALDWLASTL